MKKTFLKLFLTFALISTAFAGAFILSFTVSPEDDNAVIRWTTAQETNISKYIIERRSPQGPFIELVTINPTGSNSSYEYKDKGAYKTNDILFIYRLKIVDIDNTITYSDERSISLNVSGVKRTWGSIKAMFR
ncbi:MAG: hypothetical protein CO128_00990 [Ignavibacteriales bacterium CG_4_9_14_3_um_filter_30_11]|nr:MAG: hypothetical protein CO128_00990 [Ignavibacteriales bacterium CG_4_9_14_3_um_filter_30_11]